MYIASIAWALLLTGYAFRRTRSLHVPLVLGGIFLDISLVAYLEWSRGAIEKAVSFDMNGLQQVHIAMSTVALVLYFPVLGLGMRLFGDSENYSLRDLHKRVALTALIFRTLGFIFMFSMLKQFR